MTLVWRPGFSGLTDADAITYVAAVEAADGQALEFGVGKAINDFIVGCKLDGTWNAIKASCILAGARTLNGALVPLVGTAPTSFNFVSADYNRKTGLVGNGSTKYLNSNRNHNSDPQNNAHVSVLQSQHQSRSVSRWAIGTIASNNTSTGLATNTTTRFGLVNEASYSAAIAETSTATGFWGATRSSPTSQSMRYANINYSFALNSLAPSTNNMLVFARSGNPGSGSTATDFSDARLAFYSIGESLDLALLDTRVSALITAIGAAIP